MTFTGFDPKDGEPLFDTRAAAIERARMMKKWDPDENTKIFILRSKKIPLWFAHLLQDTPFQWLAYRELKDDES